MEFWNSILTEKSQKLLSDLKKLESESKIGFVLIGGWAVWLHTRMLKSKDIDIILKDFDSLNFFKGYYNINKNDKLKKYEAKIEEVDIDIYMPFFSRFIPPTEEILKHTTKIEGFETPIPEMLMILKQVAEINRGESVKGMKDKADILALCGKINFKKYDEILSKYKIEHLRQRLTSIIKKFNEPKYLNIDFVELKKLKRELLKKIKE